MTNNIFTKIALAICNTTLLAIVAETPSHAASFNFNFPLIDDFDNVLGSGLVSFEAEPEPSQEWEKFALTEFDVDLALTTSKTFSFNQTKDAKAVFFQGEFLGIEHNGKSQESDDYVLLIDGGDEAIKPGEPGAWSLWGPNLETGVVDTRVIGGGKVNYQATPEPGSLVGLGILSLSYLLIQKKS